MNLALRPTNKAGIFFVAEPTGGEVLGVVDLYDEEDIRIEDLGALLKDATRAASRRTLALMTELNNQRGDTEG